MLKFLDAKHFYTILYTNIGFFSKNENSPQTARKIIQTQNPSPTTFLYFSLISNNRTGHPMSEEQAETNSEMNSEINSASNAEKKADAMEEVRQKLENQDLDEAIERVQTLLKEQQEPTAHSLGILLALMMTAEIRDGVQPGTNTGPVVLEWTEKYSAQKVEEVITFARQFLTNPGKIASELSERLFQDSATQDADSSSSNNGDDLPGEDD